jgi:predicted nucleic-acid-binding Zn-ribbon protein
MLGDIKADILFFFGNPQTNGFVNYNCKDIGYYERIDKRSKRTGCICDELVDISFN